MLSEGIYDLEIDRLVEEISKRRSKRVLIQLPEGLRSEIYTISEAVERAEAEAIFSADPCYGACDLAVEEAKRLKADLIVHYGHSKMSDLRETPILYLEARSTLPIGEALMKALGLVENYQRIGLITTVQHVINLKEAADILRERGKAVSIGDVGSPLYQGQVTGCNYLNASAISEDVDAYIFIGGGRFHALGAELATCKPVFIADPFLKSAYPVEGVEKLLRQRYACIIEAEKAERFAVILGLKSGQMKLKTAVEIIEGLRDKGYSATLLALREISPPILSQFPTVEAFVNTACPRISIDMEASSLFRKPVLSITEARVVLGQIGWKDLCRGSWFED